MKIVRLDENAFEQTAREVQDALKEGNVVVFPTDTVYGLLADATSEEAVAKIFQVKEREEGKPLPVFVKDIAAAKELAEISPEQEAYLREVWPGKVTVLLRSKRKLPRAFEKDGKVGIRIPRYPFLANVLGQFGKPLTGTSANISGQPSCLDSKEVVVQFENREFQPDILVDAGILPESHPSAIIDITNAPYKTIR